jgi:hypothetical protein
MKSVEDLADEVHQNHIDRLDVPWGTPLVPRPFRPRPRPQTAIIARAALRKIQQRQAKAAVDEWLSSRPLTAEHV